MLSRTHCLWRDLHHQKGTATLITLLYPFLQLLNLALGFPLVFTTHRFQRADLEASLPKSCYRGEGLYGAEKEGGWGQAVDEGVGGIWPTREKRTEGFRLHYSCRGCSHLKETPAPSYCLASVLKDSGCVVPNFLQLLLAGCGGTLYGDSGSFTSPGYPGTYPNNTHCQWAVTAPAGRHITISFYFISIDDPGDCVHNYLILYDGPDGNSPFSGPYCGTVSKARFLNSHLLCINNESNVYTPLKADTGELQSTRYFYIFCTLFWFFSFGEHECHLVDIVSNSVNCVLESPIRLFAVFNQESPIQLQLQLLHCRLPVVAPTESQFLGEEPCHVVF